MAGQALPRPGDLRGPEELLHHQRRPDGRADAADLLFLRHLQPRLLERLARRERRFRRPGQPGHRRPCRHAAFHLQGRHPRLRRRHASGRRLRDQRSLCRRHALLRRAADPADLRRRQDHRLQPVERSLVRRRRQRAGLLRRRRPRDVPRGAAHHAGAAVRQGALLQGRRPSDRLEHARSGLDHRRHPRPGAGDAGLRARDPAARRQVWPRHGRDRARRGAGLCRARGAPAHRGAAGRRMGDAGLHRSRSGRRRGPDPDQGQADDQGRPRDLRLHRQPSDHRLDLQLGLRRDLLGGRRGHEDLLPGPAAEQRLLPLLRDHRARGQRSSTRNGRSPSPAS